MMEQDTIARRRLEIWEKLLRAAEQLLDLLYDLYDLNDLESARQQREDDDRHTQYILPFDGHHVGVWGMRRADEAPLRPDEAAELGSIIPRDH